MYLNCHSYHSLRYGAISVENLVAEAKKCAVEYLAITDINCSTGVFDFTRECLENNIKPIVGIEFRAGDKLLFVGLAKNTEGFRELNTLLTECNINKTPLPLRAPDFKHVFVIYPLSNIPKRLRDYEYVGIKHWEINNLLGKSLMKRPEKLVALHPVTHRTPEEYELHKILRCVNHNILFSKLTDLQRAEPGEFLLPMNELLERYNLIPRIILNTEKIAQNCSFDFDFKSPKNKFTYTNTKYADKELLEQLAFDGLEKRYGKKNKVATARIIKELEVIDKLNFSAYFLITWDIIRYSMSMGFYHVGRGSGANSIVAYCLYITDVDPIELNLYFERFLNPSRTSPPDFDIDWSWKNRDTILQYIFNRFDGEHTAFCGTIGTFKFRSVIRELGKVFGLPKEEMDVLTRSKMEHHPKNDIVNNIHKYGLMLNGFPNLRSMHSCGILITEHPITYYTALDMLPKGFATAQIDMYIAESITLEKLDVLSQRGLGHIKDSVDIVKRNQGTAIDIHETASFKKDAKCNKMLATGNTLGCFYIESPAMRGLLRRLECSDYNTLVAASSIIRPGVAKSGMMREYVQRHNDPSKIQYFHKVFEEQLGDTYGVMVYQEDVIKIAHHFANLGLDEADILRRGMSGKTRSKKEMQIVKQKFFDNCKEAGYSDLVTNEVYRQIESFAGYSFCKSHSASYAVESYQSLYLKAYYPMEFMVAVINNFGGFYRTEVYVHEAKMAGATIHAPDINKSEHLTCIDGSDVYLGFIHIQNFSSKWGEILPIERERKGDFKDVEDLIERTAITQEDVEILIYVGALRSVSESKGALIVQVRRLFNGGTVRRPNQLFKMKTKKLKLPELQRSRLEDAFDEIEILKFPVSMDIFDLLQTKYRGDVMVKDLLQHENKTVKMLGYLLSRKDVPTAKGLMNFGTFIDHEGAYFDTTHFPDCLHRYPFKGSGFYLLLGKVAIDFNFPTIEIYRMEKLPMVPDPRYSDDGNPDHSTTKGLIENHSKTHRAPYPSKQEVDRLYNKK